MRFKHWNVCKTEVISEYFCYTTNEVSTIEIEHI